jgi:hypothetical protein
MMEIRDDSNGFRTLWLCDGRVCFELIPESNFVEIAAILLSASNRQPKSRQIPMGSILRREQHSQIFHS